MLREHLDNECAATLVALGEDGTVLTETQLVSDGSGSLRLNKNGEIEWTEAQEALAASFRFKRTYCETPSAEELKENFLLPENALLCLYCVQH